MRPLKVRVLVRAASHVRYERGKSGAGIAIMRSRYETTMNGLPSDIVETVVQMPFNDHNLSLDWATNSGCRPKEPFAVFERASEQVYG